MLCSYLFSVAVTDLMSRCAKCNGLGYDHLTLDELGDGDENVVPEKVCLINSDRYFEDLLNATTYC